MTLQEHIRTLRKERGLSQEALAEALGVSRQAITKWEDGSALPSTANLLSLADFSACRLSSSYGLRHRKKPNRTISIRRSF